MTDVDGWGGSVWTKHEQQGLPNYWGEPNPIAAISASRFALYCCYWSSVRACDIAANPQVLTSSAQHRIMQTSPWTQSAHSLGRHRSTKLEIIRSGNKYRVGGTGNTKKELNRNSNSATQCHCRQRHPDPLGRLFAQHAPSTQTHKQAVLPNNWRCP